MGDGQTDFEETHESGEDAGVFADAQTFEIPDHAVEPGHYTVVADATGDSSAAEMAPVNDVAVLHQTGVGLDAIRGQFS